MTLIKSISGIRGTIGGKTGDGLTPLDIVKFTASYGTWLLEREKNNLVVIGRDARISGEMVRNIVAGTLQGMGINVIDLGLSTTPTVEIAVPMEKAGGGIIITASHNPKEWNALKLLNQRGEFISEKDGKEILRIAEKGDFNFSTVKNIGRYSQNETYIDTHIEKILKLDLVDVDAIKSKEYRIVVDAINSTGGIAVPKLLKALGVKEVIEMYCEPTGKFPHNPEPLPENLSDISTEVKKQKADLGFVVDPDVDRLAIVSEDGNPFGEEYTLVAVADYVLKCLTPTLSKGEGGRKRGNTVSNLSSSRALREITEKAKGKYFASAVGEVNVVKLMKEMDAVIGGEGNGGIIYPELHYGRDALVGIALFLSHLAKSKKTCSVLRGNYPNYYISKNKIQLSDGMDAENLFSKIKEKYKKQEINTVDGLKIEFENEWIHLRTSNTEPIIRIYAESEHETTANNLARKIMEDIKMVMKE